MKIIQNSVRIVSKTHNAFLFCVTLVVVSFSMSIHKLYVICHNMYCK